MQDDTRKSRLETAGRLLDHASQLTRKRELTEARRRLDEASMVLEQLPDDEDADRLDVLANVYEGKGQIALMVGRADEAYFQLGQAADLRRREIAAGREGARLALAVDHLNLAAACRHLERADEAERETQRAIAALSDMDDPTATGLRIAARQALGQIRAKKGDNAGAAEVFERALAETTAIAERDPKAVPVGIVAQLNIHVSLARFALGRVEEALAAGAAASADAWARLEAQLDSGEPAPQGPGGEVLSQYVAAQMNLVAFNEALGRFAAAEDALFKVINLVGPRPEILARGRHFYSKLKALDDAALEAGDLPRDEVDDSAAQIEAMLAQVTQA